MEHPFAASTIQETPDDDNASTIPLEAHNNAPTSRHLEPVAQGPSRQVVHNARHLREAGGTSKINAAEGQDDVGLRQRSQASSFKLSQFDEDLELELHTSRVYSRSAHRHSISSLQSKINSTTGMSCLSAISLAQISNISVFKLPIFYHEIWNPQFYDDVNSLAISHGLRRRRVGTSEFANLVSTLRKGSKPKIKDPKTGPRRLLNQKFGLPLQFTSRDNEKVTQVRGSKRRDGEDGIILGKLLFLGE